MEAHGARMAPAPTHVLIVDDDRDTREMYTAALSFLGCTVIAAKDVPQALDRARRRSPDVIVTDVIMPFGDGWELIAELRADARTRDIPIIILTGSVTPVLPARARAEGAAFLIKPCLPEELLAELHRVIDRRRQQTHTHP